MQQRKYRMIPGKLIDTTMSNSIEPLLYGQFTDSNMTDEVAEKLISKGYGQYFVDVPRSEITPVNVIEDLQEKEKKAEIKLEIFEKETKNNSLDTYSRARLAELCEKRGYPKDEWKDLVRKDLIKYVNGK